MVEDKPTQDGSYINAKHIRGVLQPSYNVDVQSYGWLLITLLLVSLVKHAEVYLEFRRGNQEDSLLGCGYVPVKDGSHINAKHRR